LHEPERRRTGGASQPITLVMGELPNAESLNDQLRAQARHIYGNWNHKITEARRADIIENGATPVSNISDQGEMPALRALIICSPDASGFHKNVGPERRTISRSGQFL